MNFERYIIIGGSWDGESILLPEDGRGNGYIKLAKKGGSDLKATASDEDTAEDLNMDEEYYIPWDITFVDTAGEEHQWRLLRYQKLSEMDALDMLINNYNPKNGNHE